MKFNFFCLLALMMPAGRDAQDAEGPAAQGPAAQRTFRTRIKECLHMVGMYALRSDRFNAVNCAKSIETICDEHHRPLTREESIQRGNARARYVPPHHERQVIQPRIQAGTGFIHIKVNNRLYKTDNNRYVELLQAEELQIIQEMNHSENNTRFHYDMMNMYGLRLLARYEHEMNDDYMPRLTEYNRHRDAWIEGCAYRKEITSKHESLLQNYKDSERLMNKNIVLVARSSYTREMQKPDRTWTSYIVYYCTSESDKKMYAVSLYEGLRMNLHGVPVVYRLSLKKKIMISKQDLQPAMSPKPDQFEFVKDIEDDSDELEPLVYEDDSDQSSDRSSDGPNDMDQDAEDEEDFGEMEEV